MGRKADVGTELFGALLRRYRGERGMTQEELAERAGLHVQTISQLELGVIRRPRSTTVQFLADALKLDTEDRDEFAAAARGEPTSSAHGPIEESRQVLPSPISSPDGESLLASMPTGTVPPRGALPAGSRMPLAPNPLFVGRGDELLQVAAALRGGDTTVALGQVVASTGLGGLGKTQLAVEFVHRYGPFFAGGVFWLSLANVDEIPLQVAACADPGLETRPLEERVRRVRDTWQSTVPRLLVFDNCEEESLLEAWRPSSGGCRVLVTSRRSHWSPTLGVTALPLDLLPRADSVELLRRYRPELAADDPGLDAIAAELGDLPLALHLAGSYLRAYHAEVSLDDYLAELRRPAVLQHASMLGDGLDDTPSPTHHVQGVAQTFALCLSRLDRSRKVDRVAIELLARMACMAPGAPVPRHLLGKTLGEVEPLQRAAGLRRLGTVGLVEEGEGWLRLHRLVAHFVRHEHLDRCAQGAVARALIEYGSDADQRLLTGSDLECVILHLLDAVGRAMSDEPQMAALCNATGLALHAAGDLRAAESWLERALALREQTLGPDHDDVAESLSNLGELRWAKGELAEAKRLFERSLAIRERTRGREHPDTAGVLTCLAVLLRSQGDLTGARAMTERVLAIREQVLGPDHPLTALSLHNLAVVLNDLGDLAASRDMSERVLAIRERILGSDHPHTVSSMHNLAVVLRKQDNLTAARALSERALTILERVLGPEHRHTAFCLHNLGLVLHKQGELAAARSLIERALAVRKRVLALDHPDTGTSLNDLADLLQAQGDPTAARPLFERALAIRKRVLGPDHPDTVATRRALAELAAEGGGPAAGG